MSSLDIQTQQGQAEQEQPGTAQAQAPTQVGQSPSTGTVPGLPPTALQMQMQSLNSQYQGAQQAAQGGGGQAFGANLQTGGPLMIDRDTGAHGGRAPGKRNGDMARTGLRDMAESLAKSYGLNFGRGTLVDPEGNFMQTPDQLAALQGGSSLSDTAASMNYVAQAINDRQVEQQQNKATAALQARLGQVQNRGQGSLAAMQSNFYSQMAAVYTDPNLLPEQADFSYWIQKDGFDDAADERAREDAENGLPGGKSGGVGGGGGSYNGAKVESSQTVGNRNSTDFGPRGAGDVVTTGPHAGQRPVYTYDPISKTTTQSWESA